MAVLKIWERNIAGTKVRQTISGDVMEEKNRKSVIRKEVLERRRLLDEEERQKAKFLLTERILGHQWYYLSDTVLGFASYGTEIDTSEILEDALKRGKKIYLPKVVGEDMLFYRIQSMGDLREGYRGIPEPKGDTEIFDYAAIQKEVRFDENINKVLMLMPGAAFDKMRNRIGYGKGFYDRYLRDKKLLQLRTIAVGFNCQLVEEIPADEFDVKPYQVICV